MQHLKRNTFKTHEIGTVIHQYLVIMLYENTIVKKKMNEEHSHTNAKKQWIYICKNENLINGK